MNNTMQNTAINTMNGALRARQGAWLNRFATAGVAIVCALTTQLAAAQDTVCASVKIRIKQELTLERQAFEAEMKINNTTDNGTIQNVSVVVKVTELDGTPVAITEDPNAVGAKFFIRVSNKQNIAAVDGTGVVNPATSAIIDWLIIPAPGSAGANPSGKKYLIGATLRYRFGNEDQTLEVSPDVVTVKPLPLLTLDYFLPSEVEADDPLTAAIEPPVPFNLGVRVKNNGYAAAKNLKIDSAQPKIVENNQGLLINFQITGSSVDDAPAQKTLLLNFNDIAAGTSKTGRWVMETTLSGRFTEFAARFSHADELGGAVTSLLQATNAHLMIRDVRVDLPGRDFVRDFLAKDGDVLRVYESDGLDTIVTDRSSVATLVVGASGGTNASFSLNFPPTGGFVYVKLPDPFGGTKALGTVTRSDAKVINTDNAWLSRSRNKDTKQWEYYINFFDVNTTGVYSTEFQAPPQVALPPVVQFIPDRVVKIGQQVAFMVEASSPQGTPITLSAAPLPTGATFTPQAIDPLSPTLRRAIFNWTPGTGTVGNYLITYTANDGTLSGSRSANIRVEANTPPPGPGTPGIESPISGALVTTLRPKLSVITSANLQDPTTKLQFEIYSDVAMSQLVASALVDKAAPAPGNGAGPVVQPTDWTVPADLLDNTHYWWRARGFDGTLYSAWANARFMVNLFNDPPDAFNLTSPNSGAEVASTVPELAWTNSIDKDVDTVTYTVEIFKEAALTTRLATADVVENPSGTTRWVSTLVLTNHQRYYWRVTAKDPQGAQTLSSARSFVVSTGNTAPSAPVIQAPISGGESANPNTLLTIGNSTDAENDLITYVFEIDTVNTFNSGNKRASGQIIQGAGTSTSWPVTGLVENQRYWWRVKAQDGRAESAWVVADFLMNAVNDPPPTPTIQNPGNQAWVATQQPSLQVNAVQDPEGGTVTYQFEVYRDAGLTVKSAEGSSNNISWIVTGLLADKTTHYWRARAVDNLNLASPWTSAQVMYVSTAPYQAPTIRVTAPSATTAPKLVNTAQGPRKQITIRWEGTDPNIEPTVALYYGTTNSGFVGNLIVDGLRQVAGVQTGSYVWDVTALPPGAYYVYAVIYDSKGVGKAYAAAPVVVPSSPQAGYLVQDAPTRIRYTSENGGIATIRMKLGRAPIDTVIVPLSSNKPSEGQVSSPAAFTFTPSNWNTWQTATVVGIDDCAPDPNNGYQIIVGNASSVDTNYIGITGVPYQMVNRDNTESRNTTNNPNIYICGLTVVSEQQISARVWEYKIRGDLTNLGVNATRINARLVTVPSTSYTIVEPDLQFGAINQYEIGRTQDTVTIRTRTKVAASTFKTASGYTWAVTVAP